jgi:hypothetical protein
MQANAADVLDVAPACYNANQRRVFLRHCIRIELPGRIKASSMIETQCRLAAREIVFLERNAIPEWLQDYFKKLTEQGREPLMRIFANNATFNKWRALRLTLSILNEWRHKWKLNGGSKRS